MNRAPIIGAGTKPVSVTAQSVPQMGGTLLGWFKPIVFGIVTKTEKDFQIVESVREVGSTGVVQPFTAEALELKPEGQRSWPWFMLHCTPDLQLQNDDIILVASVRYRVMKRWNYSLYGYMQYDVVEDYRPPGQPLLP